MDFRILPGTLLLLSFGCFSPQPVDNDSESDTDAEPTGGADPTGSSTNSPSSTTSMGPTMGTSGPTDPSTTTPGTTNDPSAPSTSTTEGETEGSTETSGPGPCGDGVINEDEVCDDGTNDGSYGGCEPGCGALGPSCGDGDVNGDEACDDGNEADGDGCNIDCIESGTALWSASYDEGNDLATSLALDPESGNVLVVALADESGTNRLFSNWYRIYSEDGDAVETGDTTRDHASVAFSGGNIVTAFTDSAEVGPPWAMEVGEFDLAGAEVWSAQLPALGAVGRVQPAGGDGLAISGATVANEFTWPYDRAAYVYRFDSGGSVDWSHDLTADEVAGCTPVSVGSGDSVLTACYFGFYGPVEIRKYSGTGGLMWNTDVDVNPGVWSQDLASGLHQQSILPSLDENSDGTIVFGLKDWEAGSRIVTLGGNGQIDLTLSYSGGGEAWVNDVAIADDGSVVFVGHEDSASGNNGTDIFVRKVDADGQLLWSDLIDGGGNGDDTAREVELDDAGAIYVFGSTWEGNANENDLWLRKYAP